MVVGADIGHTQDSAVPAGLMQSRNDDPTLKGWAILVHPSGMRYEILVALGAFVREFVKLVVPVGHRRFL